MLFFPVLQTLARHSWGAAGMIIAEHRFGFIDRKSITHIRDGNKAFGMASQALPYVTPTYGWNAGRCKEMVPYNSNHFLLMLKTNSILPIFGN